MSAFESNYRPATAELASEADRLWFKAHPDRSHRLRPALVGECPGVTAEHLIVVCQVVPGLRFRRPLRCWTPLPPGEAPEWFARGIFERCARENGLPSLIEDESDAGPAYTRFKDHGPNPDLKH